MNKEQRTINNKWYSWFFVLCFLFFVFCLILSNLAFLQVQAVGPPQTPEEAKQMGIKAGKEIQLNLWGVLKKIWREEAIPIFQKFWNFLKKIWNSYILPKIKWLWQKITTPFKKEIERRKPIIEEEFQKEKKEMKEEIKTELPRTGKTLWQKFKELIK